MKYDVLIQIVFQCARIPFCGGVVFSSGGNQNIDTELKGRAGFFSYDKLYHMGIKNFERKQTVNKSFVVLIALVTLFAFPRCTGTSSSVVKCDLEDAFEAGLAYAVEQVCGCQAAATRTWANSVVDPVNACSANGSLLQGIPLCSTLIAAVSSSASTAAGGLCNKLVPNGNCNPTASVTFLANAVGTLCSGVLSSVTGGVVSSTHR